jgi:hypothetical protein
MALRRLIVAVVLPAALASLLAAQAPVAARPANQLRDPQPENATRAILAAFDTFRVVAIGDYHGTKDLNDFVLSLVRHPAFPNVVNDIVVEGTNSFLQPIIDRYVAGEDVPIDQARQLWRETNLPTGVNDFDLRLFQLVRRINQQRPPDKRLRVLAGEPPVDWSTVTTEIYQRQYLAHREDHMAGVVENEVLRKNRKALLFYGGAHVRHGAPETALYLVEQKYAGAAFVIFPWVGASERNRCAFPAVVNGTPHETETTSWPVPSLLRTKGTWLADFAKSPAVPGALVLRPTPGVDPIDAYLYLGPPSLLLAEQPSVFTFVDRGFRAELLRRLGIIPGGGGYVFRVDPDSARERDSDVLRCSSRW